MSNFDVKKISSIYENLNRSKRSVLNELSSEYIRRNDWLTNYNIKDLPFSNIFGDRLRIILPINMDKNFTDILETLESSRIFNFVGFDYDKIKCNVKIKTQQGDKLREETLSSLVLKMFKGGEISEETKNKSIKWIEQNTKQLKTPDNSLIISRSPIDVLRMSDVSDIGSCHSPGGSYFNCAETESKSRGVVCYLIDNKEIDKVSRDQIENDADIFEDGDRGKDGLKVKARIRLRKYFDKYNDSEFLLPDSRIYVPRGKYGGTNTAHIPGVHDTLRSFLKQHQELDLSEIQNAYKNGDIVLRGGEYTDASNNELFNYYFDTDKFRGDISHEDSNGASRADLLDEELAHFQRRMNGTEHIFASYDVEDSGEDAYYMANGGITVNLDEYELYEEVDDLNIYESDEIQAYLNGEKPKWGRVKSETIRNFFKVLGGKLPIDDSDIGGISANGNNITIHMQFQEGGAGFNADDYAYFIDELKRWENKYSDIKRALLVSLHECDLVDLTDPQKVRLGIVDTSDLTEFSDEEDGEFLLNVYTGIPNTYKYIITQQYRSTEVELEVKHIFTKLFQKYLRTILEPTKPEPHPELKMEGYIHNIFAEYGYTIQTTISVENPDHVKFRISGVPSHILKHLDKYVDDMKNIIKVSVAKAFIPPEDFNKNHYYVTMYNTYNNYRSN